MEVIYGGKDGGIVNKEDLNGQVNKVKTSNKVLNGVKSGVREQMNLTKRR